MYFRVLLHNESSAGSFLIFLTDLQKCLLSWMIFSRKSQFTLIQGYLHARLLKGGA